MNRSSTLTELELLARWRTGDVCACDELFDRCSLAVHRFFSTKTDGRAQSVGDLVQETFVRALANAQKFEERSSFRTYVLSIARYVLFEYYRGNRKACETDFEVSSIQALDTTPSQRVHSGQERVVLIEALRTLPMEQQIAIELRFWEDLSFVEIAEITKVPVGTVKSRILSARKHLERQLGSHSAQGITCQ